MMLSGQVLLLFQSSKNLFSLVNKNMTKFCKFYILHLYKAKKYVSYLVSLTQKYRKASNMFLWEP
jgi:hypothetical protein